MSPLESYGYGTLGYMVEGWRRGSGKPVSSMWQAVSCYTDLGIPVLPLYGKIPAKWLKNGVYDATRNLDDLRCLYYNKGDFNLGLATGFVFDVVDIDSREGFRNYQAAFDLTFAELPTTRVRTPHGLHFYYKPFGAKNKRILPDVDTKGLGGYVVGPPSKGYSWQKPEADWELISAPPALISEAVSVPQFSPAAPTKTCKKNDAKVLTQLGKASIELSVANPGNRNILLNKLAYYFYGKVNQGLLIEGFVFDMLSQAALQAGLEANEIRATLASARRARFGDAV